MNGETGKKSNRSPFHLQARFSSYFFSLRKILGNRMATIGLSITMIFAILVILDWIFPQYLGVSPGNSLTNAMTAFHRQGGIFWNGKPYIVGTEIIPPPYGTPGALFTIVPPTLHGPSNTPSWWWWFGSTNFNLPLLPVVLASLKYDVTYTVLVVASGLIIGTLLGAVAGYYGGVVDEVVMRITDVFFSLPYLIFAIAIVYALGQSIINVIIALVIVWWPNYARLARGQALKIRNSNYIEAAVASGSSGMRNILKHVIPNSMTSLIVQATLDLGVVLQVLITLSFLGSEWGFALKFQSESALLPELGNVMSWGLRYIFQYPVNWWPTLIPGAFVIFFALGASLLGDGIRDVFDPKLGG